MDHTSHPDHAHVHGPACGHTALRHGDHVDYVHDGHLHHDHEGHVDECSLDDGGATPIVCTPTHACGGHAQGHVHGAGCGHEAIPHAGHVDYLVAGHLHHPHDGHCDLHGTVEIA